ncbi:hypothetical protein SELR_pSRC500390 (plasmid) [Selenomonas ruminantium subsp. lactilytica TAM6421]|uniref:Putative tail fiber protein gp53-like C-terminal domain-containing protein n=1 Tax=Selenomonas ruminantium subsp. lactilytica (strain NBRC 103574 / TAM6421) TaxID=927704 RepID=I0GWS6_SELRL|nr:hypothetical protein [Selenomonas ruminantium]BAL85213.1 hypothetical protein SELR_pSRC500390 [Selenomonas ruminantium subsp. lactilytica TAM6421]
MSTTVNKKWESTFPTTIGNQTRPDKGVDDTLSFETGAFPQFMSTDPVRYDKQNAAMSQAMSNDARLNEKINNSNAELDKHKKDPAAHTAGIGGNAATATKLKEKKALRLSGKAKGEAEFDGSADANISVTDVTADRCTGNSATATQTTATAANGGAADLVKGSMAGGDSFRIRVGGKDDNSWAEIATGDNGNETITVAQYSGAFATKVKEATLLDGAGNTAFPGRVSASNGFKGHLYDKADTAGRADVATTADRPTGFTGSDAGEWGNTVGTHVAGWSTKNGGSIDFRENGSQVNMKVDGVMYQREGARLVIDDSTVNNYAPTKTGGGASGTWGISVTGNAATATNAGHLSDFNGGHVVNVADKAADAWASLGSSNSGWWLKSIHTNANTPAWLSNNYSAGIAFGGSDTKGVISTAYNGPRVKFAGGNGTKPVWWYGLNGTSGKTYDLNNMPSSWNNVAGKPATFAPSPHNHDSSYPSTTGARASGTWGINITGNAGYSAHSGKVDNDNAQMRFHWDGSKGNQPTWVWGSNDSSNAYVFNPKNFSVNYSNSAGNSDKLDGYHENSFLRYRDAQGNGVGTLWSQIGIRQYSNGRPDGLGEGYNYGAVVSLPGKDSRLDLWYNSQSSSNGDGLYYRSGWGSGKKGWRRILDSGNFNNWAPTKTGGGASGTWKINVTGSAGSVAWNNVTGKPGWTTDSTKAAKTGWTRLPGNLIMQWGVVSGKGTLTITYPIEFTTFAVPVMNGTADGTWDNDDQNPAIIKQSLTGFTANSSLSNQATINWIAIGK